MAQAYNQMGEKARMTKDPTQHNMMDTPKNLLGRIGGHLQGCWLRPKKRSLSAKLLLLTMLFVMLAEILIFVPSIAKFRVDWFMSRLSTSQVAAMALRVSPDKALPAMLQKDLLEKANVHSIAVKRPFTRVMAIRAQMPAKIDAEYELDKAGFITLVKDAIMVFLRGDNRILRVSGKPELGSEDLIEIVIEEAPLRSAMGKYAWRILLLSSFISLFTASLIYFALDRLLIRPMNRLTSNIMLFSQNPEDRSRVIRPDDRDDIIGQTERELAQMQTQLGDMLQQKSRLASLGLAVSKINHDLRNILASAQLMSDRLNMIEDPGARKLVPKLLHSLDRAILLCSNTLKYGRAEEAAPERETFTLLPLVEEVIEGLGLAHKSQVGFKHELPADLSINADRNQMYRVFSNLIKNAAEAIEAGSAGMSANGQNTGTIKFSAKHNKDAVLIILSDTGPGIPARAKDHLFQAFQGSVRKGGTGLGLAIAAELLRAHGGDIMLHASNEQGTEFRITLPDQ